MMILPLRKQSGQPRRERGLTNVISLTRRFADALNQTRRQEITIVYFSGGGISNLPGEFFFV